MENNGFNERFLEARELVQHKNIPAVMALNHQLGGSNVEMELPDQNPLGDISIIHMFTLWKQQKQSKPPHRRGPSAIDSVEDTSTQ